MKITPPALLGFIRISLLSSLPRSLSLQVPPAINPLAFAGCVRWGTRAWPGFSPATAEAASEVLLWSATQRPSSSYLAPDFAAMRQGSGILSLYSHAVRPHMGGIATTHLDKVHELLGQMISMASRPQSLAVDVIMDWMGNELVGNRGVFVDPNTPMWKQSVDNMQALGVWPEVASAVCGQIQRLAALKGRPMVNSGQILGDAFPTDYKLPIEHREAVRMFFKYARGRGVFAGSLEVPVANMMATTSARIPHTVLLLLTASPTVPGVFAEATLGRLSAEDAQILMDNFPCATFLKGLRSTLSNPAPLKVRPISSRLPRTVRTRGRARTSLPRRRQPQASEMSRFRTFCFVGSTPNRKRFLSDRRSAPPSTGLPAQLKLRPHHPLLSKEKWRLSTKS